MMRLLTLLVLALLGASACSDQTTPDVWDASWRSRRDTAAVLLLEESPTLCAGCISATTVALLGEEEGPGFIVQTGWVSRDLPGNFWVLQPGPPKVFDASGAFLQEVGKEGQGPLEFVSAYAIYVDASGQVHLFDRGNMRETVVSQDFALVSERPLDGSVIGALDLPGRGNWVANMQYPMPGSHRPPLYLMRGDEVVTSFGVPEPLGSLSMTRRLWVDDDGLIYSAGTEQDVVTVWDATGQRIHGFERAGRWVPRETDLPLSRSNPVLPSVFAALHVDDDGRLWTAVWMPRSDWLEHVVEVLRPGGEIYLRPDGQTDVVYETHLEVIDLDRGEVLASGVFDGLIDGFLGDGLAYGPTETDIGAPQVRISRLVVQPEAH